MQRTPKPFMKGGRKGKEEDGNVRSGEWETEHAYDEFICRKQSEEK